VPVDPGHRRTASTAAFRPLKSLIETGIPRRHRCSRPSMRFQQASPRRSRHAKSRSPFISVLKTFDLPRGPDRVGVVCLAIIVLGNGRARDRRPPVSPAAAGCQSAGRSPPAHPGHALAQLKPFSPTAKSSRNRDGLPCSSIKQRGSIMLALILNAVYRHFLKVALPGMATLGQGDDRDRGSTACLP
jgi:hypothetical protein